ncbi:hypothetical protein [Pseudomonas aeruginosa]|uniref:hypothetical protein n=1 Tax=Pseudomonas aeruginosa TaxID=287 RepID=UPI0030F0A961
MIINQQNLRNLFIGYRAAFQNAFAGVQPDFNQFVLTVTSGNASEQMGGSVTRPRSGNGSATE